MTQILINPCYIEAIFEDGEKDGKYVVGWTQNGMRVTLSVDDLPFALSDLALNTAVRGPNGASYYSINEVQRAAMYAALDAKVLASEEISKTGLAALVYRQST